MHERNAQARSNTAWGMAAYLLFSLGLSGLLELLGQRELQRLSDSYSEAEQEQAATALLLEHEFALAIVDVQMPGMNGLELARIMRSTEKTRQIPIIFISAAGRESNYAFTGYESGSVDFLYKPIDVHAIRGKVSIFVELYCQRREVRMDVRDQGMGIPEAAQQRIFEQFERITGNDGTGGLGLGLYITRQLVEAHGGVISVQSVPGDGSVFQVTLPLSSSTAVPG